MNQNRVRSIKEIAERRGIETLCHFTRVENLSSILRLGLWGRSQLELNGLPFLRIDQDRYDGHREAVCLTVSFPNYRLFYKKREEFWNGSSVEHNQWVVLLLEASLLWELNCAFCAYNAADSRVAGIPIQDRMKAEALESMFGDFPTLDRNRDLPSNYTTSPQAEVLAFETVPVSYLREVHFSDLQGWERWSTSEYTASDANFFYDSVYFGKRTIY